MKPIECPALVTLLNGISHADDVKWQSLVRLVLSECNFDISKENYLFQSLLCTVDQRYVISFFQIYYTFCLAHAVGASQSSCLHVDLELSASELAEMERDVETSVPPDQEIRIETVPDSTHANDNVAELGPGKRRRLQTYSAYFVQIHACIPILILFENIVTKVTRKNLRTSSGAERKHMVKYCRYQKSMI